MRKNGNLAALLSAATVVLCLCVGLNGCAQLAPAPKETPEVARQKALDGLDVAELLVQAKQYSEARKTLKAVRQREEFLSQDEMQRLERTEKEVAEALGIEVEVAEAPAEEPPAEEKAPEEPKPEEKPPAPPEEKPAPPEPKEVAEAPAPPPAETAEEALTAAIPPEWVRSLQEADRLLADGDYDAAWKKYEAMKAAGIRFGDARDKKLDKNCEKAREGAIAKTYDEAKELIDQKKYIPALALMEKVVENKDALSWWSRRGVDRKYNKIKGEVDRLQKLFEVGELNYKTGKYDEAKKQLAQVKKSGVDLGPDVAQAVDNYLADIDAKVGEQKAAEAAAKAAEEAAAAKAAEEAAKVAEKPAPPEPEKPAVKPAAPAATPEEAEKQHKEAVEAIKVAEVYIMTKDYKQADKVLDVARKYQATLTEAEANRLADCEAKLGKKPAEVAAAKEAAEAAKKAAEEAAAKKAAEEAAAKAAEEAAAKKAAEEAAAKAAEEAAAKKAAEEAAAKAAAEEAAAAKAAEEAAKAAEKPVVKPAPPAATPEEAEKQHKEAVEAIKVAEVYVMTKDYKQADNVLNVARKYKATLTQSEADRLADCDTKVRKGLGLPEVARVEPAKPVTPPVVEKPTVPEKPEEVVEKAVPPEWTRSFDEANALLEQGDARAAWKKYEALKAAGVRFGDARDKKLEDNLERAREKAVARSYDEAKTLIGQKKYIPALELMEEVVQNKDALSWLNRRGVDGNYEKVKTELSRLQNLFAKGEQSYQAGNYEEAKKQLSEVRDSGADLGPEVNQAVANYLRDIDTKILEQKSVALEEQRRKVEETMAALAAKEAETKKALSQVSDAEELFVNADVKYASGDYSGAKAELDQAKAVLQPLQQRREQLEPIVIEELSLISDKVNDRLRVIEEKAAEQERKEAAVKQSLGDIDTRLGAATQALETGNVDAAEDSLNAARTALSELPQANVEAVRPRIDEVAGRVQELKKRVERVRRLASAATAKAQRLADAGDYDGALDILAKVQDAGNVAPGAAADARSKADELKALKQKRADYAGKLKELDTVTNAADFGKDEKQVIEVDNALAEIKTSGVIFQAPERDLLNSVDRKVETKAGPIRQARQEKRRKLLADYNSAVDMFKAGKFDQARAVFVKVRDSKFDLPSNVVEQLPVYISNCESEVKARQERLSKALETVRRARQALDRQDYATAISEYRAVDVSVLPPEAADQVAKDRLKAGRELVGKDWAQRREQALAGRTEREKEWDARLLFGKIEYLLKQGRSADAAPMMEQLAASASLLPAEHVETLGKWQGELDGRKRREKAEQLEREAETIRKQYDLVNKHETAKIAGDVKMVAELEDKIIALKARNDLEKAEKLLNGGDYRAAEGLVDDLKDMPYLERRLGDDAKRVKKCVASLQNGRAALDMLEQAVGAYKQGKCVESDKLLRKVEDAEIALGIDQVTLDSYKQRIGDRSADRVVELRLECDEAIDLAERAGDYAGAKAKLLAVKQSGVDLGADYNDKIDRILEQLDKRLGEVSTVVEAPEAPETLKPESVPAVEEKPKVAAPVGPAEEAIVKAQTLYAEKRYAEAKQVLEPLVARMETLKGPTKQEVRKVLGAVMGKEVEAEKAYHRLLSAYKNKEYERAKQLLAFFKENYSGTSYYQKVR